jgi:hypothetical protein
VYGHGLTLRRLPLRRRPRASEHSAAGV